MKNRLPCPVHSYIWCPGERGMLRKWCIWHSASLCRESSLITTQVISGATEHQHAIFGSGVSVIRVSGVVTLECCSWPPEVTVKGLWQMIFSISRNNQSLDFFPGRQPAGKTQSEDCYVLLMLVLVGVGKVTLLLDWVPLGHRYWDLTCFGSSHPQHIVCCLPLILFIMSDSHLILSLERWERPEHIFQCRGDNVKINLWETTGLMGKWKWR